MQGIARCPGLRRNCLLPQGFIDISRKIPADGVQILCQHEGRNGLHRHVECNPRLTSACVRVPKSANCWNFVHFQKILFDVPVTRSETMVTRAANSTHLLYPKRRSVEHNSGLPRFSIPAPISLRITHRTRIDLRGNGHNAGRGNPAPLKTRRRGRPCDVPCDGDDGIPHDANVVSRCPQRPENVA